MILNPLYTQISSIIWTVSQQNIQLRKPFNIPGQSFCILFENVQSSHGTSGTNRCFQIQIFTITQFLFLRLINK